MRKLPFNIFFSQYIANFLTPTVCSNTTSIWAGWYSTTCKGIPNFSLILVAFVLQSSIVIFPRWIPDWLDIMTTWIVGCASISCTDHRVTRSRDKLTHSLIEIGYISCQTVLSPPVIYSIQWYSRVFWLPWRVCIINPVRSLRGV